VAAVNALAGGACGFADSLLLFRERVRGIGPLGLIRHPGPTPTVA
jgi:hypothetical protein